MAKLRDVEHMTGQLVALATSMTFTSLGVLYAQHPTAPPTAKQFVRKLYSLEIAKGTDYSSIGTRKQELAVYSNSIVKLLQADAALHKGEIGAIDADPLCQCQDSGTMQVQELKETRANDAAAAFDVTLLFLSQGDVVKLRLLLVHQANGWRIDDVLPAKSRSLRELLSPSKR